MAAPPKPWEKPGVNRQIDEPLASTNMSGGPTPGIPPSLSGSLPSIGGGDAPPPVPSRPSQLGYSSPYSSMGYGSSYSSPYSSYGGGMYNSPYSGGGMYNSYGSSMYGGGYGAGGYGMGGFNRYGGGYNGADNDYNSFSRMAEESSRPAFQSIESIVGAFSSVSMMLDSTFQAVYNSFRAVVGVADNFSRMKMQFAQIFSAFAVFRTLRYMYRRLLVLLRLRPQGFAEDAWVEAGDSVIQAAANSGSGKKKSSWPVLMFFAIIMGGPWLIWKFLQSTFSGSGSQHGWAAGSEDHFVARAIYSFQGDGNNELSFQAGANLHIAPKELQPRVKGWLLASVDGKTVGLVPANYVKVLGKRRGTQVSSYPVQNGLDSFSETNQNSVPGVTLTQSNQAPPGVNSSEPVGFNQSPSAINFEQQLQTAFNSETNLPAPVDSMLPHNSNPLDAFSALDGVPDVTEDQGK